MLFWRHLAKGALCTPSMQIPGYRARVQAHKGAFYQAQWPINMRRSRHSKLEHWIVAPVVAGSIPVTHPVNSEGNSRFALGGKRKSTVLCTRSV